MMTTIFTSAAVIAALAFVAVGLVWVMAIRAPKAPQCFDTKRSTPCRECPGECKQKPQSSSAGSKEDAEIYKKQM